MVPIDPTQPSGGTGLQHMPVSQQHTVTGMHRVTGSVGSSLDHNQLTEGAAWGGSVWLEQGGGQKGERVVSGITVCIALNPN